VYGSSGCKLPNFIKNKKLAIKNQKLNFIRGLNCIPLILDLSNKGKANKITRAPPIQITPPILDGIERNIA
jgi:hypothetical protein